MKQKHTRKEIRIALLNIAYFFPMAKKEGNPAPLSEYQKISELVKDLLLENLSNKQLVSLKKLT